MARRKAYVYSLISVLYMALVFFLSWVPMKIEVSSFSWSDQFAHMVLYGILACLIYIALREMNVPRRFWLVLAFAVSFLYGTANEIFQHFLPWRQADINDVVANGIGAFCFPLLLWLRTRYQNK